MEFKCCYGCMRELDAPGTVCPNCGFDNTNDPARQPRHVLKCGTVLAGHYVVGRMLGQGGFGITYIGYDLNLETPVCIKEYYPEGAAMRSSTQSSMVCWGNSENAQGLRDSRKSFIKEAQKAVKLRDLSHVVSVWGVFSENETSYIVMDYIEGETLKTRLVRTQKTLSEQECMVLVAPVMRDLEKAHTRGIIHRDIKPENIMLDAEGEPVLLDMGAAKDLAKAGQDGGTLSSTMVVSQGFSPREQYRAKGNIGPWTDVYAMCATICYCVTGKVPPTPMDREDGEAVELSAFSPAVAQVVEKGLALKIEDRIQSMGELLDALTAALANPNVKPEQPKPEPPKPEPPKPEPPKPEPPKPEPPRPEPPKPKSNRLVPVLVVAAALLIAAGVYFARGGKPDVMVTPLPSTDVTAALTEAVSSAEPGDTAKDMYWRGVAYAEEHNYEKALEWYEKAADAGSAGALYKIGEMYEDGRGVTQDYKKALAYYTQAADAGSSSAMFQLGRMAELGRGMTTDYEQAFLWYQKAAEAGHKMAMNNLAAFYQKGLGTTQDYSKSMEWLRKAASVGESLAMFNIGVLYENGFGVEQDYYEAAAWYQKAVDAGNTNAMLSLAFLYEKGKGVSQNYEKAMKYYLEASDEGNAKAQYSIGELYYSGHGVEKDFKKASEWFLKSAENGLAEAMCRMGILYENGKGVPQDYKKAMEWYLEAVEAGQGKTLGIACYNIGKLYERGFGVEKNSITALDWYQKAKDAGYTG
ncbi:MAG: SEL1-like repeat protein [Oscillospiraceae bacterium]|nr:SEL1-like repeat protein [Oscillospiraceae bacterium]